MTTNLERASLISRHVELESVTLVSARLESKLDPLSLPEAVAINHGYRAKYEIRESRPDHVYVSVEFRFQVRDESEQVENGSAGLQATYLLVYRLGAAATYPSDAIEHFASLNGTYNAWPYWRELVQTVCGRIGLAAVIVPVFRPPVQELEKQEELSLPSR